MLIYDSTYSDHRLSKPGEPTYTPGTNGNAYDSVLPGLQPFFWTGWFSPPKTEADFQRFRNACAGRLGAIDFELANQTITHSECYRIISACALGGPVTTFGLYNGIVQNRYRNGARYVGGDGKPAPLWNGHRARMTPIIADMVLRRLDGQARYLELLDVIQLEAETHNLAYANSVYLPAWRNWNECVALRFPHKKRSMWVGINQSQPWPVETVQAYYSTAMDAGADIVLWGAWADAKPVYEELVRLNG